MLPQRVAMYCTGGMRCEKASAYLIQHCGYGPHDVLRLKGGGASSRTWCQSSRSANRQCRKNVRASRQLQTKAFIQGRLGVGRGYVMCSTSAPR